MQRQKADCDNMWFAYTVSSSLITSVPHSATPDAEKPIDVLTAPCLSLSLSPSPSFKIKERKCREE